MKKLVLLPLILGSSFAQAELLCNDEQYDSRCLTMSLTLSPSLPFLLTSASSNNLKEIVEAQEDAAVFVASSGQIRTAKFQNILESIRSANPKAQASDVEIAQAILSAQ